MANQSKPDKQGIKPNLTSFLDLLGPMVRDSLAYKLSCGEQLSQVESDALFKLIAEHGHPTDAQIEAVRLSEVYNNPIHKKPPGVT